MQNSYIFTILVSFFALRCAAILVFKISVPQAQKGWEPLQQGVDQQVSRDNFTGSNFLTREIGKQID